MSAPLTRAEAEATLAYLAALETRGGKFVASVSEMRELGATLRHVWAEHDQLFERVERLKLENRDWERDLDDAMKERDSHEEWLNEIFAALGMSEEDSTWSSANDPREVAVDAAMQLRKERDTLAAQPARAAQMQVGLERLRLAAAIAVSTQWGDALEEETPQCILDLDAEIAAASEVLGLPVTDAIQRIQGMRAAEQRAQDGAAALELLEWAEEHQATAERRPCDEGPRYVASMPGDHLKGWGNSPRQAYADLRAAKEATDGKA